MSSRTKGRFCHSAITITTGSNDQLRWRDVGAATSYTATLAAGTYFVRGDVTSDGEQTALPTGAKDLLWAIKDALDDAASAIVFAVSQSHTEDTTQGKVTLSGTAAFNLLWTDALTTIDGTGQAGERIGFDTSADDTGASTYTSDNPANCVWYPRTEGDLRDHNPVVTAHRTFAVSGAIDVLPIASSAWLLLDVTLEGIPRSRIKDTYSAVNVDFETFFDDLAAGGRCIYFPDNADTATTHSMVLRSEVYALALEDLAIREEGRSEESYRVELPLRTYVAAS